MSSGRYSKTSARRERVAQALHHLGLVEHDALAAAKEHRDAHGARRGERGGVARATCSTAASSDAERTAAQVLVKLIEQARR
jgi:hypothetical protein